MAPLSLANIEQQIQQLENQLKSLRGAYHAQQSEMSRLQERKKELQTRLQQVEQEIANLTQGDSTKAKPVPKPPAKKPSAARKAKPAKKSPPPKTKATTKPAAKRKRGQGQPTLRQLVTGILQKARKPLKSGELAEQVLATGYQTSSKNFKGVVSVLLADMDNLEHVKDQGYRFKQSKG